MKLRPGLNRSGRVWMDEIKPAPQELVDLVADALVDFGPDGHCDGAEEIAAIVVQWFKDEPV